VGRREHAAVAREQVEHPGPGIEPLLAVQPEDRAPVASLDDLEPYPVDGIQPVMSGSRARDAVAVGAGAGDRDRHPAHDSSGTMAGS
jgi:hypothetical protein